MTRSFVAVQIIGWLVVASAASADVIHLVTGSKQTGVVIADRPESPSVTLRTASGDIAVARSRIARIEKESEAKCAARLADQNAERGKWTAAAEGYRKSLQLDPSDAEIAGKLRHAEEEISIADAAKVRENAGNLRTTIEKALMLSKEGRHEEAASLLLQSEPAAGTPALDDWHRAMAQIHIEWGTSRADRQDYARAAEKLEIALKHDPGNEQVRDTLMRIYESDPTKVAERVDFLRKSSRPEDRIKLADALFRNREYEESLAIYLELIAASPDNLTKAVDDRVRLMFDMVHRQQASRGEYDKAAESYRQFLEFSPAEDPSPLAKYEFMVERAKTDLNDIDARLKLALFAEERGLADTARKEYANIISAAPDNPAAAQAYQRFAVTDLQDATDFFAAGQYVLAAQKTKDIIKSYAMFPDVVAKAQELAAKAGVEVQKIHQDKQDQGVLLAQRGDDYYNQALTYLSTYMSKDVDPGRRVVSPKAEATKYLRFALYAYQQALAIDPSLGDVTKYDLHRKISDTYAKYTTLTNATPPRLPRRAKH